jgi:hypothetical protein
MDVVEKGSVCSIKNKKELRQYTHQTSYLVRNCKYSCGFALPGAFDFSLDEISKKTVKQLLLSRPHIFQAVVFPSPMTVSATLGPFCKAL